MDTTDIARSLADAYLHDFPNPDAAIASIQRVIKENETQPPTARDVLRPVLQAALCHVALTPPTALTPLNPNIRYTLRVAWFSGQHFTTNIDEACDCAYNTARAHGAARIFLLAALNQHDDVLPEFLLRSLVFDPETDAVYDATPPTGHAQSATFHTER